MDEYAHSWDDLRLILAIADGGGLSGASRLLSIHHATVLRRLNVFEHRMGVVLFDRNARGYVATDAGEELAKMARSINSEVGNAYRQLAGQDLRLSGTIRLATSDFLAQSILPPVLAQFRQQQPSIEIEVTISPQFASLTKRDADIALRAALDPPDTLEALNAAAIGYGVYCHKSLVGAGSRNIEEIEWIGDDQSIAHVTTNRWRLQAFRNTNPQIRFDSLSGKFAAIRGELGAGFVPHFLAKNDPDLICLEDRPDEWQLPLWLLTHPDLRKMNRIRAFLNCAEGILSQMDFSQPLRSPS